MTADGNIADKREDLREVVRRIRRERDKRIAEIWEWMPTLEVEPDPGLQRLVDTQDEFRDRIMGRIERIIASAPF